MSKFYSILVILILLFSFNLFLFNSYGMPYSNLIYQQKIIIFNNQNVSTPNPYQQEITLNETEYNGSLIYNGNFANFEFTYENGSVIPSWIQENNSNNLIIWLKLDSINAFSSITIYLDIFSKDFNMLGNGIGEAPGLTSIYGEYDNGNSVFTVYINGNTPLSDFTVQPSFNLSRTVNGYLNLTGMSAWSGNGDIAFRYDKVTLPSYYSYVAVGYGKWWSNNTTGDTDIVSLIQTNASIYTNAIGLEGIPGAIYNVNRQFGIDLFSDGGFHEGLDTKGVAGHNWVYGSITYIAGASNFTAYAYSGNQSYSVSYSNTLIKSNASYYNIYLGVIGDDAWYPNEPMKPAYAWYQYLYVRSITKNNIMPEVELDSSLIGIENQSQNSETVNLVFNSQFFSFNIDQTFLIYFILIIAVVFIVFMGIASVIKRGR